MLTAVTTADGHVRHLEYDAANRLITEFEPAAAGFDRRSYQYNAMSLPTVIRTGTSQYRPDTHVHGVIDGVYQSGGSAVVSGWACSLYMDPSIDVHLYVGGPAGSGTGIVGVTANAASEGAVAQACWASGTAYRFSINLDSIRAQHGGKRIYVHGISPVGRENHLIGNSGQFVVPTVQAPPPPAPPTPPSPPVPPVPPDPPQPCPTQQCVPWIGVPGTGRGATALMSTPFGTDETSAYIDYDEQGRVIARRGNAGQNVRYRYDANDNVEKSIDSSNRETTFSYDVLNRPVRTVDAKQGVTEVTYDAGDRVVAAKDPRGLVTSYLYDGFGQLWSQISPDTGTTTFQYSGNGQQTSLTRNDGRVLSFLYADPLGRLTQAYAGQDTRQYWYDNCLANSPDTGRGQLCRIDTTNAAGALTTHSILYYSPYDQLTARHDTGSGANDITRYAYDGMGRLTGIEYPTGMVANYSFERGKLRAVTATSGLGVTTNVATQIEHQPFGAIKGWTYGNGLKRLYGYDDDGRLFALSTADGPTVRQSLTYAWTADNFIRKMTNGVDATQTHEYEYDELGRLAKDFVGGSTVGSQDQFDAVGNRVARGTTAPGSTPSSQYAISPTSNRMDSQSGNATRNFAYSSTGNLGSSTGWLGNKTYAYDAFDRLSSTNIEGNVTQYVINALGQRMQKAGPLGTFRYVYAGQNTLLGERGANGWKQYIYLAGQPVALVMPSGIVHYLHNDHLGRPESATRTDKMTVWKAANASYHRTVTLDLIAGINLGFPGQTWDAETDTWHNGFRDYDPYTGRYIQSDPIGLSGGVNTYAYVGGNPVNFVDPLGLRGVRPPPRSTSSNPNQLRLPLTFASGPQPATRLYFSNYSQFTRPTLYAESMKRQVWSEASALSKLAEAFEQLFPSDNREGQGCAVMVCGPGVNDANASSCPVPATQPNSVMVGPGGPQIGCACL